MRFDIVISHEGIYPKANKGLIKVLCKSVNWSIIYERFISKIGNLLNYTRSTKLNIIHHKNILLNNS